MSATDLSRYVRGRELRTRSPDTHFSLFWTGFDNRRGIGLKIKSLSQEPFNLELKTSER